MVYGGGEMQQLHFRTVAYSNKNRTISGAKIKYIPWVIIKIIFFLLELILNFIHLLKINLKTLRVHDDAPEF